MRLSRLHGRCTDASDRNIGAGSVTPSKSRATSSRFTRISSTGTARATSCPAAPTTSPSTGATSSTRASECPSGSTTLDGLTSTFPQKRHRGWSAISRTPTKALAPPGSSTVADRLRDALGVPGWAVIDVSQALRSGLKSSTGADAEALSMPTVTWAASLFEGVPLLLEGEHRWPAYPGPQRTAFGVSLILTNPRISPRAVARYPQS